MSLRRVYAFISEILIYLTIFEPITELKNFRIYQFLQLSVKPLIFRVDPQNK